MPVLTLPLSDAARCVRATVPETTWNPIYRQLAGSDSGGVDALETGAVDAEDVMLHQQFTAPALLVLAVTTEEGTDRVRVSLSPQEAGLESSHDDAPSRWETLHPMKLPERLDAVLKQAGLETGALATDVEDPSKCLTLTRGQSQELVRRLRVSADSEAAIRSLEGVDERLRDALTATGTRLALTLTLHDPSGQQLEAPFAFSRLWVRGEFGMYRMDSDSSGLGPIQQVSPRDVLGTVMALLDQGLRFTTACIAADRAHAAVAMGGDRR